MIIHEQTELDYDDVLLLPHRSKHASRKEVVLTRDFKFYHSPRIWNGIPIFCSNMGTTGTIQMGLALAKLNLCTALHKFNSLEDLIGLYNNKDKSNNLEFNKIYQYCWYTSGIRQQDKEKLEKLTQAVGIPPNIVIDVPNGYTDEFVETCSSFREMYPEAIIMAGNVCTGQMVQELILHGGVDIVKVGIGPSRNCDTRIKTGVGRPMISGIIESSHAAHGLVNGYDSGRLGLICADGGCKSSGDVAKAFCANADLVMLGGLFAGCEECDGEWEYEWQTMSGFWQPLDPGTDKPIIRKKRLKHYGMSSDYARKVHYTGETKPYITSEGNVSFVDYKGSVENIVADLLGGLASTGTYIGSSRLKDFAKCAEFVKVNRIK